MDRDLSPRGANERCAISGWVTRPRGAAESGESHRPDVTDGRGRPRCSDFGAPVSTAGCVLSLFLRVVRSSPSISRRRLRKYCRAIASRTGSPSSTGPGRAGGRGGVGVGARGPRAPPSRAARSASALCTRAAAVGAQPQPAHPAAALGAEDSTLSRPARPAPARGQPRPPPPAVVRCVLAWSADRSIVLTHHETPNAPRHALKRAQGRASRSAGRGRA